MNKTLFVCVIIALVFFSVGRNSAKPNQHPQNTSSVTKTLLNLRLNQNEPQISDLTNPEATMVQDVINNFENSKYQKDFVEAINQLSKPQTEDEKGWLDHLLGNDLAPMNNNKPSPRFNNNANHHLLVGYNLNRIYLKNEIVYAEIEELRNLNLSNKYEVQMQKLTFEIVKNKDRYEISRYYHTKPTSKVDLKYEGFVAY